MIGPEYFSEETLREIARKIEEVSRDKEEFELKDVLDRLDREEMIQLGVDLSEEMDKRMGTDNVLDGPLGVIRLDKKKEEERRLRMERVRAEDSGDEAKEVEALRRYMEAKGIKERGK